MGEAGRTTGATVRRRRRLSGGVAALAAIALLSGSLGWAAPGGAQGPTESAFQTSDYGTSVDVGTRCWRGFAFEVAEDTTISALIGGVALPNGGVIKGAIWEGTYDGITDTLEWGVVVAEVTYPEGEVGAVPLASPVTLAAGQVYIIGIGLVSETFGPSDDEYYVVEGFDSSSIAEPGSIISEWISPAIDDSMRFDFYADECYGEPVDAVGESRIVADIGTSAVPAIGFTYAEDPEPTTSTTSAPPSSTTSSTTAPGPEPVTPRFTG